MKFLEKIVKSIDLTSSTYVDSNGNVQVFKPLEIYLVPKGNGETTHERYVLDNNNIISKASGGGDFVPMSGVPDDRSITGNIVVGNKSFSQPITNPSEYKSLIKDGYYFNQGLEYPPDGLYSSSSTFYVNGSGLNYKKSDPSSFSPYIDQASALTINDYGVALYKHFNDGVSKQHSININQYGLELSAYRGVNNPEILNRYVTGFSLDATTQKAGFLFGNPEIDHPSTRFRRFEFDENGFRADTDYSAEVLPLDYVQKKYVDEAIASAGGSGGLKNLVAVSGSFSGVTTYERIGNYIFVRIQGTTGGLNAGDSLQFQSDPFESIFDITNRRLKVRENSGYTWVDFNMSQTGNPGSTLVFTNISGISTSFYIDEVFVLFAKD